MRLQQLDAAQILLGDAPELPSDVAPWQPQTLPDNWSVSRPHVHGYAWYRLRFDLPQVTDDPHAVFLPWLRTIGAVYVNGVLVGRTGDSGNVRFGPRPQYFVIPGGCFAREPTRSTSVSSSARTGAARCRP